MNPPTSSKQRRSVSNICNNLGIWQNDRNCSTCSLPPQASPILESDMDPTSQSTIPNYIWQLEVLVTTTISLMVLVVAQIGLSLCI
ncbi:uncharacterized protein M6B38_357815 [Iris pallida]|uniref:Uncharacterized protein n=1 Tax=Iris pallida TaxID=29817 RepID=A0AAX6FPH4_IRIPA|nr:uncharacterized protein M6B38_409920 [Iris pallida]KAJ6829486.1 uncharacterized protein M6B38_357815 [Iris pallida]